MPALPYLLLLSVWLGFSLVFFMGTGTRSTGKPVVSAPRAKWGLLFQAVALGMVWIRQSSGPRGAALLALALAIGVTSALCAVSAKRHLGKQWRVHAGLLADHDLIMSGPYAALRHPIYAAMFGMLLMTGLILSPWEVLAAAIAIFLVGTEIRVRAEDRLLEDRFGGSFREYRGRVRAYIPFIR